ncbi:MAG: 3'(2'),5'-bisphosphate nucleotidase CysQ, partial [Burkholderiales bacterium]
MLIQIADQLESALIEAGEAILARYRLPEHAIQTKADLTPVTDADIASHDLLCDALARVTPDWPVVSEEDGAPADQDPVLSTTNSTTNSTPYWLLDPLDGTKEFIARTGEFSINLGLVIDADA